MAADVNHDQTTDLVIGTDNGGVVVAYLGADGAWPVSGGILITAAAGVYNGVGVVDLNARWESRTSQPSQTPAGRTSCFSSQAEDFPPRGHPPAGLRRRLWQSVISTAMPWRISRNEQELTQRRRAAGERDGTFQAAVPYATGTTPTAITAGDVDGDGHLDLIVANTGATTSRSCAAR